MVLSLLKRANTTVIKNLVSILVISVFLIFMPNYLFLKMNTYVKLRLKLHCLERLSHFVPVLSRMSVPLKLVRICSPKFKLDFVDSYDMTNKQILEKVKKTRYFDMINHEYDGPLIANTILCHIIKLFLIYWFMNTNDFTLCPHYEVNLCQKQ